MQIAEEKVQFVRDHIPRQNAVGLEPLFHEIQARVIASVLIGSHDIG
jgi:hypothetical protein